MFGPPQIILLRTGTPCREVPFSVASGVDLKPPEEDIGKRRDRKTRHEEGKKEESIREEKRAREGGMKGHVASRLYCHTTT